MKTILLAIALAVASLTLSATDRVPSTKASCSAVKGQWCEAPSIPCGQGPSWCNLKALDAGKSCSSRSQCEGSCVPISPTPIVGAKEPGQCSVFKDAWLSGDRYFIVDGVVEAAGVV